jgi:hypothetical protein
MADCVPLHTSTPLALWHEQRSTLYGNTKETAQHEEHHTKSTSTTASTPHSFLSRAIRVITTLLDGGGAHGESHETNHQTPEVTPPTG